MTTLSTTSLSVIILAAGKGTRMKSTKAKVLHHAFFQPMISHVIQNAAVLAPAQIAIVVGHQKEAVEKAVNKTVLAKKSASDSIKYTFITQREQLGTGHAVLSTKERILETTENTLILCGDTPLIRPETLWQLYNSHIEQKNDITLLTTTLKEPFGYGRIITNSTNNIQEIVEEKDADCLQRKITTVNAGIYCVKKDVLFEALAKVGTENKQNEMYLTDIIRIGVDANKGIRAFHTKNVTEILGVNSRYELAKAEKELQMRQNLQLMMQGVTLISPHSTRISPCSKIEQDCLLEPFVTISEKSQVGENCHIEQGVILKNSHLGKDVTIGAGSYIANSNVPDGTTIFPHTYIR